MSFGFSIGDIILLSQLSYNLWNSITIGRKDASRDLQELESVLFSLRCSLDHLGDVARDVLASADDRHGGPAFKENLNRMIDSCGSTLRDLDILTKKYRYISTADDRKEMAQKESKRLNFDDVARRVKVNWRKVRWDQEKQSLQYYREKLESHTSAINLVLTSMVLRNTVTAEESSKKGHEKTHTLLDQVLKNPQTDASLQRMIQEIYKVLMQPDPRGISSKPQIPTNPADNEDTNSNFMPIGTPIQDMASVHAFSVDHITLDTNVASGANEGNDMPEMIPMTYDMQSNSHERLSADKSHKTHHHFAHRVPMPEVKPRYHTSENPMPIPYRPKHEPSTVLPSSTIELNARRRAFAAREYKNFKQRHAKPEKPAFLRTSMPTVQQLQDGARYIFRPLPPGVNAVSSQKLERQNEIIRWAEGFREFIQHGVINDAKQSEGLVNVLIALNEAIEKSNAGLRNCFYRASDQAQFSGTLEKLQEISKSVRVLKEVEEFEDARDDWAES